MSCNPLEIKGPDVPPVFSGYPIDDRGDWEGFRREYDRTHRPLWESFNAWVQEQGAPALPDLEFIHASTELNLFVYPQVADYPRPSAPLDGSWHRLDSSVRTTDTAVELPEHIRSGDGALVYFSLGSLGSADVELMMRVIGCLADTPHRYLVSKGPLHAEIDLAPNMWGAEFLPQTALLPLVDLVITHGGNNTTTEAFHFGKPMVMLPLFWDQYDNAQRVQETGYGVRLDTYGFTDTELRAAIDRLLADTELRARMAAQAVEIRARKGLTTAADLIEAVGRRRG